MDTSPQKKEHLTFEIRAKVSTKGQVVIPIDIRRVLGLEDGDHNEVIFRMEDGVLYLEVAEQDVLFSPDELAGMLDSPDDDGNFQLDLPSAREERADAIVEDSRRPLADE